MEEAEAKLESSTLTVSDYEMKWPIGKVHPIVVACSGYPCAFWILGLFPSFSADVWFFPSTLCVVDIGLAWDLQLCHARG